MQDDVKAVERELRRAAEQSSAIQRQMAEAKSLRQEGNEEGRKDLYWWPAPEQTLEGRAAAALANTRTNTPLASGEAATNSGIPREIAEQVLSMGRVQWGATAELTEAGHLEHLAQSLRLTREHFSYEDAPVAMHGLYLDGTETVLCHTGTSPNSGPNAQALAGAWNWLHDVCSGAAALTPAVDEEMVAKVARAIHDVLENDDDSEGGGYLRAARAAITASNRVGLGQ